jgi:hypothetical protein
MPLEQLREMMQWLPFFSLMNRNSTGHGASPWTHPVSVRLIEAAIIGGVVLYGTVQATETKLNYIGQQLEQVRAEVQEIRQQLRLAEQELWRRRGLEKLAWMPQSSRSGRP